MAMQIQLTDIVERDLKKSLKLIESSETSVQS